MSYIGRHATCLPPICVAKLTLYALTVNKTEIYFVKEMQNVWKYVNNN